MQTQTSNIDNLAPAKKSLLSAATVTFALLVAFLAVVYFVSIRNGLLFLVGTGFGLTLAISGVGFAGPWRNFIVRRETRGLITNLILLAAASLVFLIALDQIPDVIGNSAPLGVSVIVGAFLFGIGMQLAGGCGSGTLVQAAGGNQHSIFVLIFFLPGSVIGTLHLPWWLNTPNVGVISITEIVGIGPAILLQVIAFFAISFIVIKIARASGNTSSWRPTKRHLIGCAVIILLALTTLIISGRMWSITFANALWGAKILDLAGFDIASTEFWSYPYPANALSSAVLADVTSVMNIGLLGGVAAYNFWKQDGREKQPFIWRQFIATVIAGLLLGYGARLAFGCNIGALFSGTASGSLHAWLWFGAAWCGCHVGIMMRPFFRMAK